VVIALLLVGAAGVTAFQLWPWRTESSQDPIASHWQQAQEAFAAQDYLRAQKHLEQCLELCPLDAEAHFLLARACRQIDDEAGWQTHLHQAALLQWSREEIQLETALMKAQSGDINSVQSLLLGYLDARHPEEVLIVEALVKGYLETFRLKDVLSWTGQWMERYPEDARPWVYRGRAFYLSRSPSRAIPAYKQALQLNPDQAEAHLQLAGVLMVQSDFEQALPHFQACLRIRPDDPTAQVGASNCYYSLGRMKEARTTLDELFAKHPLNAAGFLVRAKLELAEEAPAEALKQLKQAEALAPHEIDITYTFISVLGKLGRYDEALKYQQKLRDLRQQLDVLENVRRKINRDPTNVALRHEAGMIALRLGQEKEAVNWFVSVLQIDPNHAPTRRQLSAVGQRSAAAEGR
jgi:tetratricopeptide (TPR) repeat protein